LAVRDRLNDFLPDAPPDEGYLVTAVVFNGVVQDVGFEGREFEDDLVVFGGLVVTFLGDGLRGDGSSPASSRGRWCSRSPP
jgi:hypothetical protein